MSFADIMLVIIAALLVAILWQLERTRA